MLDIPHGCHIGSRQALPHAVENLSRVSYNLDRACLVARPGRVHRRVPGAHRIPLLLVQPAVSGGIRIPYAACRLCQDRRGGMFPSTPLRREESPCVTSRAFSAQAVGSYGN
jgi:hypothetical protein